LATLNVPSRHDCAPYQTQSRQKNTFGRTDHAAIREAIETGRLAAGARLPSWRDLAVQLGVSIRGLQLEGMGAWMEDPGFPLTRTALGLAGMTVTAVPVDAEGLDIAAGVRSAAAALAVVTPGQQAPLGVTMSLPRRLALLEWARRNDAWIIEDDYMSELQLTGRAAPALASLDHGGRVLHIGSFSKTISPALRLGFLVVPPQMAPRFGELAVCLAPAPAAAVQRAVAEVVRKGHYLRHLRRMKRLYAARREALLHCLREVGSDLIKVQATAGMAVVTLLPGRGDFASRGCVRRGPRFARLAVRPGAGSAFALVYAVHSAAGTAAQRDQFK
jgi:DNA-binding transcriptional MocR family regulator